MDTSRALRQVFSPVAAVGLAWGLFGCSDSVEVESEPRSRNSFSDLTKELATESREAVSKSEFPKKADNSFPGDTTRLTAHAKRVVELSGQGNALAQAELGLALINGTYGVRDPARGLELLTKAADQGLLFVQFQVADIHQKGLAGSPNPELALKWYTKAGNAGHLESLRYLGDCYRLGTMVPVDLTKSTEYYNRVLAADVSKVPIGLASESAVTYRTNATLQQDRARLGLAWNYYKLKDKRAFDFARRAARNGLADAQYLTGYMSLYGVLTDKDLPAAVAWLTKAGDQGHEAAQFILGLHFKSVGQHKLAADWMRVAAGQGHTNARFHLGLMYWQGLGRMQDRKASERWFNRVESAAIDGDDNSEANMGYFFETGIWKRPDLSAAAVWYAKAAAKGNTYAQCNLGKLYAGGRGVKKDATKAADWFRKAAARGYAEAQYQLGRLYELGSGVQKDIGIARDWYQKAADQGNVNGIRALQRIKQATKGKK